MTYYVYIMASASRVLYTGVTNNIERRARQHNECRVPGFSARYRTRQLVYVEPFGDVRAAIAREKQIKGWLRTKKLALIRSLNPHWADLSRASRVATSGAQPRICHSERSEESLRRPNDSKPGEILRPQNRDSE
jgi:putative endonuclease